MLLEIIKVLEKDNKTVKSRLDNYLSFDPIRFKVEDRTDFINSIVKTKKTQNISLLPNRL